MVLPPFPTDVPTHPLLVVDYELIQAGDEAEIDKLWDAATKLGFWYLKNHGVDAEVDGMFEMGRETMALPLEEKMQYDRGGDGTAPGYKAAGTYAIDEHGTPDMVEYINIAQDDALAYPQIVHRTYPRPVEAHMTDVIIPFVRKSAAINIALMAALGGRLGLPAGTLEACHRFDEHSGCEARAIKTPPRAVNTQVALGGHTDFGSLTFLHNRLGGLQVLVPGTDSWQYIKPVPGHAICNVGDSLALLSGGIIRANMHRVVLPPGDQAGNERWSVLFFTRPGGSIRLRALEDESEMIADAVRKSEDPAKYRSNVSQGEWYARRRKNQHLKNRTGPETWKAGRGMEHRPDQS